MTVARKPPALPAGLRIKTWAFEAGLSISRTTELIAAGRIASVRIGNKRIITTDPAEFRARKATGRL